MVKILCADTTSDLCSVSLFEDGINIGNESSSSNSGSLHFQSMGCGWVLGWNRILCRYIGEQRSQCGIWDPRGYGDVTFIFLLQPSRSLWGWYVYDSACGTVIGV